MRKEIRVIVREDKCGVKSYRLSTTFVNEEEEVFASVDLHTSFAGDSVSDIRKKVLSILDGLDKPAIWGGHRFPKEVSDEIEDCTYFYYLSTSGHFVLYQTLDNSQIIKGTPINKLMLKKTMNGGELKKCLLDIETIWQI